jgi:D-serine deaminase-like pyridoxal phosphate-dependent protein
VEAIIMAKQATIYPSLDTPAVILDMDKLETNIREMSDLAREARLKLRPHVKVHGSAEIARMQIESGACGVEVGPIAQAEAVVDAGIYDVLIAHPFYGEHKLDILKRILEKSEAKVTIVVDMIEQAKGVSQVAQSVGREINVAMKIDTSLEEGGLRRFGISPGESALNLAEKLSQLPGVAPVGIYAHEMGIDPTTEGRDRTAYVTAEIMCRTAKALKNAGFRMEHVSVGATPTFRSTCRFKREGKFPEITEIHPGHCVIGDLMYIIRGGETLESCATTVLSTVVSLSHNELAVIDAGFKTLGRDPLIEAQDKSGFRWNEMARMGIIKGHADLFLGTLGAESGLVYYMETDSKLTLGQQLEIIPNNASIVLNTHDQIYGVRNGEIEKVIPVTGRGKGN